MVITQLHWFDHKHVWTNGILFEFFAGAKVLQFDNKADCVEWPCKRLDGV